MIAIAIDGACRRNGKPDCVASGGIYVEHIDDANVILKTMVLSDYELCSTNQRGELLALLTALDYAWSANQLTYIITDSEYLFNAMQKEWYIGWESRGWLTAENNPVKNSDIWRQIVHIYRRCVDSGVEIVFYHIKGHCIPFGKVTANTLLSKDPTGTLLRNELYKKYDSVCDTSRKDALLAANELSLKNNGFKYDSKTLRDFVVYNSLADAIATKCVDAADALLRK